MTNYGRVRGAARPKELEIGAFLVFVASNITTYEETIDDHVVGGYEYDYTSYTKDEYITILAENSKKINELEDELQATKIILGVE